MQARQEGSQTVPERPGGTWAALEHSTGARVPPDVCWLAAYLTNRCDVVSDGNTPRHRMHGRRVNTPVLEFVEKFLGNNEIGNGDSIWYFRWHAELMVKSSCRHRARAGDQDSCRKHQTNSRVEEMGCGPTTRNAGSSVVSGWNAFDFKSDWRGSRRWGPVLLEKC